MSTVVQYGLRFRKTQDLVRYSFTSNSEADFCADVSTVLSDSKYDPVWLCREEWQAKSALSSTDSWWNEVRNKFDQADLEVVQVAINVVRSM